MFYFSWPALNTIWTQNAVTGNLIMPIRTGRWYEYIRLIVFNFQMSVGTRSHQPETYVSNPTESCSGRRFITPFAFGYDQLYSECANLSLLLSAPVPKIGGRFYSWHKRPDLGLQGSSSTQYPIQRATSPWICPQIEKKKKKGKIQEM